MTAHNVENVIEPRHGHRVIAAAVRLQSGLILVGVRHLDALMQEQAKAAGFTTQAHFARNEQGFVDNKYVFLTRAEAYRVALAAHQFDPADPIYSGSRGTLYSEDLW